MRNLLEGQLSPLAVGLNVDQMPVATPDQDHRNLQTACGSELGLDGAAIRIEIDSDSFVTEP